jgi:hypothetical protein
MVKQLINTLTKPQSANRALGDLSEREDFPLHVHRFVLRKMYRFGMMEHCGFVMTGCEERLAQCDPTVMVEFEAALRTWGWKNLDAEQLRGLGVHQLGAGADIWLILEQLLAHLPKHLRRKLSADCLRHYRHRLFWLLYRQDLDAMLARQQQCFNALGQALRRWTEDNAGIPVWSIVERLGSQSTNADLQHLDSLLAPWHGRFFPLAARGSVKQRLIKNAARASAHWTAFTRWRTQTTLDSATAKAAIVPDDAWSQLRQALAGLDSEPIEQRVAFYDRVLEMILTDLFELEREQAISALLGTRKAATPGLDPARSMARRYREWIRLLAPPARSGRPVATKGGLSGTTVPAARDLYTGYYAGSLEELANDWLTAHLAPALYDHVERRRRAGAPARVLALWELLPQLATFPELLGHLHLSNAMMALGAAFARDDDSAAAAIVWNQFKRYLTATMLRLDGAEIGMEVLKNWHKIQRAILEIQRGDARPWKSDAEVDAALGQPAETADSPSNPTSTSRGIALEPDATTDDEIPAWNQPPDEAADDAELDDHLLRFTPDRAGLVPATSDIPRLAEAVHYRLRLFRGRGKTEEERERSAIQRVVEYIHAFTGMAELGPRQVDPEPPDADRDEQLRALKKRVVDFINSDGKLAPAQREAIQRMLLEAGWEMKRGDYHRRFGVSKQRDAYHLNFNRRSGAWEGTIMVKLTAHLRAHQETHND